VIVRQSDNGRDIPIPQAPDSSRVQALGAALSEIAELRGDADLSAIEEQYSDWYRAAKKRFQSQPNADLAMAYFNRHRGHILKLAVVFEASQSRTLRVSAEAFQRAVTFASRVERTIFELLPTGMSTVGYDLSKMETRIRQAGPEGLSQNQLTRSFQSMRPSDREQGIRTLIQSGTIHARSVSTGGRSKLIYVHDAFSSSSENRRSDESQQV
jgi:hypothetical protein